MPVVLPISVNCLEVTVANAKKDITLLVDLQFVENVILPVKHVQVHQYVWHVIPSTIVSFLLLQVSVCVVPNIMRIQQPNSVLNVIIIVQHVTLFRLVKHVILRNIEISAKHQINVFA